MLDKGRPCVAVHQYFCDARKGIAVLTYRILVWSYGHHKRDKHSDDPRASRKCSLTDDILRKLGPPFVPVVWTLASREVAGLALSLARWRKTQRSSALASCSTA